MRFIGFIDVGSLLPAKSVMIFRNRIGLDAALVGTPFGRWRFFVFNGVLFLEMWF